MAKKKTTGRRLAQGTTPRTFGNGRAGQTATAPAEAASEDSQGDVRQAMPPRSSAATGRPTFQEYRRRAAAARAETRPHLPLRDEYRYVPGDLKHLGLLASGMVVLMLVLGLILH